jgi:thiol-disulfide isomerase/thioredoxin
MEIVFFYDPACPYSIKARPYAQAIAKEFKAEYLEYSARDEQTPVLFKSNEYPQLHIIEDGEIKKTLKGFSSTELQTESYRRFINNYINKTEGEE